MSFMKYADTVKDVTIENFAEKIDAQEIAMKEIFDQLTPELLNEEITAWGG